MKRTPIPTDQNDPDRLLTSAQVARICGMSTAAFYQRRWLGQGPTTIKLGRALRFRRSDVDAWLDAGTERTTGEKR